MPCPNTSCYLTETKVLLQGMLISTNQTVLPVHAAAAAVAPAVNIQTRRSFLLD
jgi:hypothetical protein